MDTDASDSPSSDEIEFVLCSRRNGKGSGCQNVFPVEFRLQHGKPVQIKRCPTCRSKASAAVKKETTKAVAKKWRGTKKGREYTKRANHSDRQRATSSKYEKSDKGKAANKRQNDKPLNNIRKRLYKLTKNSKYESDTLRKLNGITNEAFCTRLQSTFKPWMTWDNHGKHTPGAAYGTMWQIGHIIPCDQYNPNNEVDMKNCFDLTNLFAQDARENLELCAKLPSSDVLYSMKSVWPVGWGGVCAQ